MGQAIELRITELRPLLHYHQSNVGEAIRLSCTTVPSMEPTTEEFQRSSSMPTRLRLWLLSNKSLPAYPQILFFSTPPSKDHLMIMKV